MNHRLICHTNPQPPRLLARRRRLTAARVQIADGVRPLNLVEPMRPKWLTDEDLHYDQNADSAVSSIVALTGTTDISEQEYLDIVFGEFTPDGRKLMPSYRAFWQALRLYEQAEAKREDQRQRYRG